MRPTRRSFTMGALALPLLGAVGCQESNEKNFAPTPGSAPPGAPTDGEAPRPRRERDARGGRRPAGAEPDV